MSGTIQPSSRQTLFAHVRPGDNGALLELQQAALSLKQQGDYFASAYAMERAAFVAWGDPDVMRSCALGALDGYRQIYDSRDPCSLEALTAILLILQLCRQGFVFGSEPPEVMRLTSKLMGELAQRLVTCFQESPDRGSYLVRGIIVETDLGEKFEAIHTDYETHWGVTTWTTDRIRFQMPSAFLLFRYLGDHHLAQQVIDLCPDAFTTPGLRGWKAAVQGFIDPQYAPESFDQAADAFAEDVAPESDDELQRRGTWDSMNVATWAPFFRVRSLLAATVREPQRVRELIARAAVVADPEADSRGAPNVRRLASLVRALDDLLSANAKVDVALVRNQFLTAAHIGGPEDSDEIAIRFLTLAAEAFEGFRMDPEMEFTTGRLGFALDALTRLPLLGLGVSDAIGPAIRKHAWQVVLGPIRTWMHRTLQGITDEDQLRHLIYRLSQASLPLYVQKLHGPVEYGKDVVVYFEQTGRRVLRMYQAKIGDISLSDWHNTSPQLEDMFHVSLPDFVIPAEPTPEREGVLICNGHANAYALPAMRGWFETQRRDHGWEISFMNIDDIVQWIERERLINEFKAALGELRIPIEVG